MNDASAKGVILGIARRNSDGEPMQEVQECNVIAGRGIDTENRIPGTREVTFLSNESWVDTCEEVGADLSWTNRRANFLVEGVDLDATIGCTLAIGDVRIRIHGETKPCGLMDRQHEGLRRALAPACRGGVHGEVITGGTIRVGDAISVCCETAP